MKPRRRLFTLAMVTSVAGVAACAAVLGIDDRKLDDDSEAGRPDGAVDVGADADASVTNDGSPEDQQVFDVPIIPDAKCEPSACNTAGGACVNNACQIKCDKAKDCTTIACPPDTDCQVLCEKDKCIGSLCTGGSSCAFECNGDPSCEKVACSSPTCAIHCNAKDSCKTVYCDGGVCDIDCFGENACKDGVSVQASQGCAIDCKGKTSCSADGVPISCGATPDASILCGTAAEACVKGVPTCRSGEKCEISCPVNGCTKGVCCEAGTCNVTGAQNKACK